MENHGKVTSALKRMIAWVSSNAAGCRYCQAHAIRAAERYGANQEQLKNIWEYRTHEAFNEAERVALDFALAASQIPNSVDAELEEKSSFTKYIVYAGIALLVIFGIGLVVYIFLQRKELTNLKSETKKK